VPNYELAPDCQGTEILRVVVREQASEDFIDQLVHDVSRPCASLRLPQR
jgi:glutamate decarboxylase